MADNRPQPHFYQQLDIEHLPVKEKILALQAAISQDSEYEGFDTLALEGGLSLLEAEPNRTVWEMPVTPRLCNKSGNLHGGAAATIMDNLTSTALVTIAKPGFLDAGHVSRTITMTYLRPVPRGSTARIECDVQAAGRNTANIVGKLYVNGKLAVTCVHDKAVFKSVPKL
jgi:acyl-coenzyme A thioesterase 13